MGRLVRSLWAAYDLACGGLLDWRIKGTTAKWGVTRGVTRLGTKKKGMGT